MVPRTRPSAIGIPTQPATVARCRTGTWSGMAVPHVPGRFGQRWRQHIRLTGRLISHDTSAAKGPLRADRLLLRSRCPDWMMTHSGHITTYLACSGAVSGAA
jgi:hypothetical protein